MRSHCGAICHCVPTGGENTLAEFLGVALLSKGENVATAQQHHAHLEGLVSQKGSFIYTNKSKTKRRWM